MTSIFCPDLVKALTGHFDLETVVHLDISSTDLSSLDTNVILPNAKTLNCSYNNLSSLTGLSSWTSLTFIDASNNCINDLSDLKNHPTLSELILANNNISSIEQLAVLKTIPTLDKMYLKFSQKDSSRRVKNENPFIENPKYREIISAFFPNLSVIDGVRLKSENSNYLITDYSEYLNNNHLEIPNLEPIKWIDSSNFELQSVENKSEINKLNQTTNDLFNDLRKIIQRNTKF
ncbi:hypothetical protein RCL1_002405 [Eukaryota sp. TZLM3-RCL]